MIAVFGMFTPINTAERGLFNPCSWGVSLIDVIFQLHPLKHVWWMASTHIKKKKSLNPPARIIQFISVDMLKNIYQLVVKQGLYILYQLLFGHYENDMYGPHIVLFPNFRKWKYHLSDSAIIMWLEKIQLAPPTLLLGNMDSPFTLPSIH